MNAPPSPPAPPSPARATLILVLVTLLWGVSFPLVKSWQEAAVTCPGGPELASSTLIVVRMTLALLVLGLTQPRLVLQATKQEHFAGATIGVAFSVGFLLQVLGMAYTTPALSAFITSLGSAWVPLLAFLVLRMPIRGVTLLGLVLGVAGTVILGRESVAGWSLGTGEALTLLASLLFAVQILLLDRLGRRVRSTYLTVSFLGVTALLSGGLSLLLALCGPGVGEWLTWTWSLLQQPAVARDLALLVLLPTVLAFHWMNVYQPHVSAGRVALIYLLEPVFAAAFSIALGYDSPTRDLFLGGGLILGGNLLLEVPFWVQAREATTKNGHK